MKAKNALITGSTSGIGLSIAKKLALHGYNIILNGLGDTKEILKIQNEITQQYKVSCIYINKDLSNPKEVENLIGESLAQLGSIEVLVNNAGIQHIAAIENFPAEKWDQIIAINLTAVFHAIRSVIPSMKQHQWGRIINIASAHGLVASPLKSAYVASKHGVIGLTKSVALEVANENITCNAICPGYVLTPLVEKQIPEIAKERHMTQQDVIEKILLDVQPIKKFVESEEIAAAVLFLCSDESRSITGISLPIEGGWTAR